MTDESPPVQDEIRQTASRIQELTSHFASAFWRALTIQLCLSGTSSTTNKLDGTWCCNLHVTVIGASPCQS